MHVVFVLANCNTAPYFNWFAEESSLRKDIEFSFVAMTPEFPKMIEDVARFGCKGYWVKYDYFKRRSNIIKATWNLYKLFKKLKPTVVHTHLFDDSLAALFAARLANVKVRAITKGDTSYHYIYTPKWVIFDKFNNSNATNVIAPSAESFNFILEVEKCKKKKVSLIHHGIPTTNFINKAQIEIDEFKSNLGIKNKFIVGSVSRFIKWKNQIDILKAILFVKKEIPEIFLLLIGTGDYKSEIESFIKENDLVSNVKIIEKVDYDKMPLIFSCFDVFLHAAYMEPFGFVIAEAMMAGIPVVSTPTGAAKDAIMHLENGYLAEYNSPESLANGLRYFFINRQPKPFLKARQTALSLYDFKMMYNNYEKLYLKAIDEKVTKNY